MAMMLCRASTHVMQAVYLDTGGYGFLKYAGGSNYPAAGGSLTNQKPAILQGGEIEYFASLSFDNAFELRVNLGSLPARATPVINMLNVNSHWFRPVEMVTTTTASAAAGSSAWSGAFYGGVNWTRTYTPLMSFSTYNEISPTGLAQDARRVSSYYFRADNPGTNFPNWWWGDNETVTFTLS